jgi:hypothetical protein
MLCVNTNNRLLTIPFLPNHSCVYIDSEHHDHKHGHEKDEKPAAEESETPAWKKQALDQTGGNPMSLNWNVDKMEE